jgi:hypothetical protein
MERNCENELHETGGGKEVALLLLLLLLRSSHCTKVKIPLFHSFANIEFANKYATTWTNIRCRRRTRMKNSDLVFISDYCVCVCVCICMHVQFAHLRT